MTREKGRACALFCLLLAATACEAAATASGRNWRIDLDSLRCEGNSLLVMASRIHYLGPKGLVEAPVTRLVDGEGREILPRSFTWKSGDKNLARWLAGGGVADIPSEAAGDFELKFDTSNATGALKFEFGDVRAFPITRAGGCTGLLKTAELKPPAKPRPSAAQPGVFRIYRAAYPCAVRQGTLRTIEAEYPPYLPKQLIVLGRGFLPSAREIALPMGKAPAQSYLYTGIDKLDAIDDAARRAIAMDFPDYGAGLKSGKFFTFNWGQQKSQSGNQVDAIAIYEAHRCAE